MEDVGELRLVDISATLDRRTHAYYSPFVLAKHVLRRQGRLIEHGSEVAWTFLIPTPLLVEQGLRSVLTEALNSRWSVQKRGLQLKGSTLTFNPDLVFAGGLAVGDVKYKLFRGEWNRADLYQVHAFAGAYRSRHCALVGFRTPESKPLPPLAIGDVEVRELCWPADTELSPILAAQTLVKTGKDWLSGIQAVPA
jgi:5-methylcytosine-specific restriction endonuclease McrBC regulatory subunit McrC